MKAFFKFLIILTLSVSFSLNVDCVFAGNKDRVGEAGAAQLLINPFARSSGWGGVNTGNSRGLEAMYTNIAGTAFTQKTELIFANTTWLQGSGISINTFGIAQKVGETGVLCIAAVSVDFGESMITTTALPDGGLGYFSPKFMNINVSYAKMFSNSIYGGVNIKILSEKIADASAEGVAIDAGIQYVTGDDENIKFGISLKNIGTTMSYGGDGLSFRGFPSSESDNESTLLQRSSEFELPSLLNIGFAYDYLINDMNVLTFAGNFRSNSFTNDQYSFGLEYGYRSYLYLRTGYTMEDGLLDETTITNSYNGPSAGFSVDIPFNKEDGSKFSFDYAYRTTVIAFGGTHTVGARISL